MADVTPHLIYAAAWASFGLGHSLLARDGFKRRFRPLIGAAYRIAYNAVAAVHLVAVFGRTGGLGFKGLPIAPILVPFLDYPIGF